MSCRLHGPRYLSDAAAGGEPCVARRVQYYCIDGYYRLRIWVGNTRDIATWSVGPPRHVFHIGTVLPPRAVGAEEFGELRARRGC